MSKDIQDYLDKGIKGSPELKPHEKKRYLGEFEERLLLAIENKDMTSNKALKYAESVILSQPTYALKINSSAPTKGRMNFIKLAQKHNIPFTIIQSDQSELDAIGLIYVAETAVNCPSFLYDSDTPMSTHPLDSIQTKKQPTKPNTFFDFFK